MGAAIGEIVAEEIAKSWHEDGKLKIVDGELDKSQKEILKAAGTIAAVFGTSFAGGDAEVAQDTAQNAVENNLVITIPALLIAAGIAASKGAVVGSAENAIEQIAEDISQDKSLEEAILGIDLGDIAKAALIDGAIDGMTLGAGGVVKKGIKVAENSGKIRKGGEAVWNWFKGWFGKGKAKVIDKKQVQHIFRNKRGHLSDTCTIQKLKTHAAHQP